MILCHERVLSPGLYAQTYVANSYTSILPITDPLARAVVVCRLPQNLPCHRARLHWSLRPLRPGNTRNVMQV